MSRGEHLSLEEARKEGLLKQFAKEHPNETDADRFERLMKAMASGKTPEVLEASGDPVSED
jgi:hypothetical protein